MIDGKSDIKTVVAAFSTIAEILSKFDGTDQQKIIEALMKLFELEYD